MKSTLKVLSFALLGAASSFTLADEPAAEHSVSGNISVLSSYNLRGITNTPENSGATLQGGLDYNHASGFYAGWWGSTLDYSLVEEGRDAFENNFYAGYSHSVNDDLGLTIGTTYYYYYESDEETNGFELLLGLSYKDLGITAQTLLEDTTWGNAGDTYIKGTYSYALPNDFSLDTALGLYAYEKSGDYVEETSESFGFRHFDIGLSKPLADTGVTASINYIIGGYDRMDVKQKNKVVFGLGYSF
ncbi:MULTISPECIES: TorF family putative porin [Acinetobacter]|uniref:TorF family putative porin n=1 Tax=Acinetobacter TaxID=469 RepID=UPI00132F9F78|nr:MULTISPECIES: TorF family putative porin [Acinetobacter]